MVERVSAVREGTSGASPRQDVRTIAPRREPLYGTTSSLLHGVARVGYCFRVAGTRGVATELTDALSRRIKKRRSLAPSETGPGGTDPGNCSWAGAATEWTMADLTVTHSELAAFMAQTRFPRFYYPGGRRVRYALWHKVGFTLCGLTGASVVVDAGAGMGIWGRTARQQFGCTVWDVDGRYPPGLAGHRIGAPVGRIPLPSNSVSHVVSFCSFNCFEGSADTEFLRESFRLLRPGGRLVIVPLCIGDDHVNLFDPSLFTDSDAFDPGARRRPWPGWGNRFGRWYDQQAFCERVIRRGPAYQRTLVRVDHDLSIPGSVGRFFAALFVKPGESS